MSLSLNYIYDLPLFFCDLPKGIPHQYLQILLSKFPLQSLQKPKEISKKYNLRIGS
ncbi:MAG: hypothetical protein K1000chlam3_00703 [Chlamydiae bacterium]|nr:hypothetical protein [Chlamydiota bacterium]